MKIKLTNEQMLSLQKRGKLYSYLSNTLPVATFRVGNGKFVFGIFGESGSVETSFDIESNDKSGITFSMNYSKWLILIQKFSMYNEIEIEVKKDIMYITTPESLDKAVYSVDNYQEYDDISLIKKEHSEIIEDIKSNGHYLTVTENLESNLEFMLSMFSNQSSGNTIGLYSNELIYADNTVVLKASLEESIDKKFVKKNEKADINNVFIKLITMLYKENSEFVFSDNYERMFWADSDTELVYQADVSATQLPTDEEFNAIKPQDDKYNFSVKTIDLLNAINFFNGVFEGTEWKPLTFVTSKKDDVLVSYNSETANLTRQLIGVKSNSGLSFIVPADTLKVIVNKICERLGNESEINIVYDKDSDGIYVTAGNTYKAVIVKLEE